MAWLVVQGSIAVGQPTQPEPRVVYAHGPLVRIALDNPAEPPPAVLQLLVSRDGGRSWSVHGQRASLAGPWETRWAADGRYWVAQRALDAQGRASSAGPVRAEVLVIVDSKAPLIALELTRTGEDRILGVLRATDLNLVPASLQIAGHYETDMGGQVDCPQSALAAQPIAEGFEQQVAWTGVRAGRFVARVSIADAANNRTTLEKEFWVETAHPQEPNPIQLAAAEMLPERAASEAKILNAEPVTPAPRLQRSRRSPVTQASADDTPAAEDLPPGGEIGNGPLIEEALDPAELPPANSAPAAARAELLLRAARNSVALDDLPEALARFEELLRLAPRDDRARFEYAGLLLQANRLTEGRQQLERLTAERPQVTQYRLALADVLLRLKDFNPAREELRRLLADPRLRRQAAIRLARSYLWEQRPAEAQKIFDEQLRGATSLTAAEQLDLARLEIEMDRPADALRLLNPLAQARPEDEPVAAALVLAHVRLNLRLTAIDLIERVNRQQLKDPGLWLDLASQLYDERALPEALLLFQQIVRQQPNRRQAVLGIARTHLRLFQVEQARQVLNDLHGDPNDREFSTALADYQIVIGEYAQAVALAERRLRLDPHDLEAGVLLGDAYHAARNFALAEAAYQAALAHTPANDDNRRREIRRLLAKNYAVARQFDAALMLLETLIAEQPADIASRLLEIETLIEAKRFGEAEAAARSAPGESNPRNQLALRVQLAYVLLKQGRTSEAVDEFQALAADSNGRLPDVAYGWYRGATLLKQPAGARAALALGPSALSPPAEWSVRFAGRAMAVCDCCAAGAVLDDALKVEPTNVVLLTLRGEAALQCDCDCRRPECGPRLPKLLHLFAARPAASAPQADGWFRSALQISPTNIRARLGLARCYKKHLEYPPAAAEYDMLMAAMPDDTNLVREAARMVEGWQGFEASSHLYQAGQAAVQRNELVQSAAPPVAAGFGAGQLVGPEPSAAVAPPVGQALSTEENANYLRSWRPHQAIPIYQGLTTIEPTNEAAMFNLAQSQSTIGRTQCAIDTYQQLLAIDPCHQDAAVALERNEAELGPKLITGFEFTSTRGRMGLANITFENYSVAARRTLGDENEYFEVGYRERVLQPTDGPADVGEIPFVHWQEKFAPESLLFADVAVEQYQYGFHTRPTFTAGIDVLTAKDSNVRIFGFLKNYYVNGEAIRQDIHTGGVEADVLFHPARLWTLSGFYRLAVFSDQNVLNQFNINSAHMILQGRRQLRGLIDYNFYSYAEQTTFGPIPGSLVGTTHPYFAPSAYSYCSAGLEWKQWLSCDTFKGANEHWYSAYFGGAVDSNRQGFFLFTGRWQHDLSESFSWTMETNLTRSLVYDVINVITYGTFRFR